MSDNLPDFENIPGFLTKFGAGELRLAFAIASAIKQIGGISGGGSGGGGDASASNQVLEIIRLASIDGKLNSVSGRIQTDANVTGEVEVRNEDGNPLNVQGTVNADNMPSIFPVISSNFTQSGAANANGVNLYAGDMTGVNCISFQLFGTWVATVQLQFSNNNLDWVAVNPINAVSRSPNSLNITSNGLFVSESFGMFYRLRVVSYTSGLIETRLLLSNFPASYALPSSGGGGGGGGDASALKQDEQTLELMAIRARLPVGGAAADGTDATGVNAPAGASGIRGWLSGLYSLVFDRLPAPVANKIPVGVEFPVSQAVHNVSAHGLDIAVSANNTNFWTDEFGPYTAISFQLTGTWSATVQIQFSNNNNTWIAGNAINVSNLNYTGANITGNGVYACLAFGRYYRIRTTAYASGTIVLNFTLKSIPPAYFSNNLAVDVLKLPANSALSDTIARNINTTTVGSAQLFDNGVNLVRARGYGGTGEGLGRGKVATGTGSLLMLSSVSAPTNGLAVDLGCAYDRMSFQVIVASGSVTSATIVIDGSLNGIDWGDIHTINFAGVSGSIFAPSSERPAIFFRARLTAIAGGGTLTVLGCGLG